MQNDTSHTQAVCIAILPFENISEDRGHDYLAMGFCEDLITDLACFHSLQVISSYTARKIGAKSRSALDEARELAIDYLLSGSLRRRGEQLRITAQLLAANDGHIVWAQHFDAPMETIFEIQDEIVEQVVGAISAQIDQALLAAARKKPLTSLAAYDCWLRGMDQMRQGTPEADLEARRIFKQALEIDPAYSRAYAGLSLSHFNDWSCQLWEQWEETEHLAYDYALKASRLDEDDHIVQMILGRVLLYRRQYELAEAHLDRSLTLNSNDADTLAQISTSKSFLGQADQGEVLYHKARRLNPYRGIWYCPYGAFTHFVQRQYDKVVETALQGPLTDVWVDLPAFLAAAYAYLGHQEKAAHYLEIFIQAFADQILHGKIPESEEIVSWMKRANPFKHEKDTEHMIQGVVLAGLTSPRRSKLSAAGGVEEKRPAETLPNRFVKAGGVWEAAFGDQTVRIPEVKGFLDIVRLLSSPGNEVHCLELMGGTDSLSEPEAVLDTKARRAYEERMRDLQDEIREAEEMNDLGRAEKASMELDQLTEHLANALGLGGRTRKLKAPADRARSAVTWRIRSAIRKIEAVHPTLGNHLTHAIRTGTFCSYNPETPLDWIL